MFAFKVHPAAISVTDGIQHAFEYLGESWRSWLPIVLGLAAANLILSLILISIVGDGLYYVDRFTNEIELAPDAADKLLRMVPVAILYFGATVVAGWALTGIAIAGLRGWKLTASVVVRRGLVVLASGLLVLAVVTGAILVMVVVTVVVPPVGILALLGLIPVAIYMSYRISFATYAIFDGFGPLGGLQESWRLSERAVLRIFGWGLMAGLISGGISMAASSGAGFMSGSDAFSAAVAQGVSGGVGGFGTAFSTFFIAVLYESQRARHDPSLYPVPAYPVPPAYPYPYPYPVPPGSWPPPNPYAQPGGPAAGAPPNWPPQGGQR